MTKGKKCRITLLDQIDAFDQIQKTYDLEREKFGDARNITKVTANSPAAWMTTNRAIQVYLALKKIDVKLRDLLCLYVSFINGCEYCIDDAAGNAILNGWSISDLEQLIYLNNDSFNIAERAALKYTKALTLHPTTIDDSLFEELEKYFDTEAILEITTIISMKNFWNRFASALQIPSEKLCSNQQLIAKFLEHREIDMVNIQRGH